MEREVGGGIGMGSTCKPMAVSFQCMTKSTTIKKIVIILKKITYIRTQSLSQFTFIWKEIMVLLLLISRDLDSYNLK